MSSTTDPDANGLSHLQELPIVFAQLDKLTDALGDASSDKSVIDNFKSRYGAFKVTVEDVTKFFDGVKGRGEANVLDSLEREGPHLGKINFNIAPARLVLAKQVKLLPEESPNTKNSSQQSRNNLQPSKIRELEGTFKTLNTHRLEIIHAFWHLQHRFLKHQVPFRSIALNSSQPWCFENETDAILASFLSTPFQIQVELQRCDLLLQLYSDERWRAHMQQVFDRVGGRWMEVQMINEDTVTVSTLARVQLDLLRRLQAGLRDGSTDKVSGAGKVFEAAAQDANANPEVSRFDQVIDVSGTIHKAIKRVEGQKFSIAFCGMVKAGYATHPRPPIHRTDG
jgi:hypothetical protein